MFILYNIYNLTMVETVCSCLFFRVESGKAGCFSPKVAKKENVRKSLRLRFNLGKSSRDPVSADTHV